MEWVGSCRNTIPGDVLLAEASGQVWIPSRCWSCRCPHENPLHQSCFRIVWTIHFPPTIHVRTLCELPPPLNSSTFVTIVTIVDFISPTPIAILSLRAAGLIWTRRVETSPNSSDRRATAKKYVLFWCVDGAFASRSGVPSRSFQIVGCRRPWFFRRCQRFLACNM